MTEAILETSDLTKRFGEFTAVDSVDFSIEQGETKAIVGPNGAGKTTFQNLLTGKLYATEGDIMFKGQNISSLAPHERAKRGIIRKYQITSIYESMSVIENMRMALRGSTTSIKKLLLTNDDEDISERIQELLKIGNLHSKASVTAGELSYGEQQWLEILMTVGAEPDLLLLDEPTSGMSISETDTTVELISDLSDAEEMSIIVVEHNMEFIQLVSDSLTVLHQGEIIASGTGDEIKSDSTVQKVYLKGD
jgi:ABC-type branched-subunit amino acid transport system ATPase component